MRARAAVIVILVLLAIVGVSSSRQAAADTHEVRTFLFPFVGNDTFILHNPPYWRVIGDSVNGTREINITKICRVEIHLALDYNTASPTYPHNFSVSLNDVEVGTFTVSSLARSWKNVTFSLGEGSWIEPIDTPGSVKIRYELTYCVDAWRAISIKADGSSTITLSDGYPPKTKKYFALQALGKLRELRDHVGQSDIDQGPKRSLLSKLDRAIAKMSQALVYIDDDRERQANNKLRTAKNLVSAFIKAVDAFPERIVPYSEAWQEEANSIMGLIQTAIETPISI